MSFNFEVILFYVTALTGVITLVDVIWLARKRGPEAELPLIIDYARSFFPVLVLVFTIRSFLYEPFRIPSSSLEPTLLIGDFILVNKFDYGTRLPIFHQKVIERGEPKRGDIIVFRWPPRPSVNFIKRVAGIPGDKISYIDRVLYVNGQQIPQVLQQEIINTDDEGNKKVTVEKQEDLLGVKHLIHQNLDRTSEDFRDIVVPPGMYFALGDNRDNSADSRFWGFVPEENIVGKAVAVWMSWNSAASRRLIPKVRWDRIGKEIV